MMTMVATLTAAGLYVAERNLAAEVSRELQGQFHSELAALHNVQEVRQAALAERCRALVRKPRIHAALEDNALDLLYPSAQDELRDVVESTGPVLDSTRVLRAEFYRFLDLNGAVISPPATAEVGELSPAEESGLALKKVPRGRQLGYLAHKTAHTREVVTEIIAVPIISTETDEVIAALVLGFKPVEFAGRRIGERLHSGIWVNGLLYAPSLLEPEQSGLHNEISRALTFSTGETASVKVEVGGEPHLLFSKRLNPDSLYPPAYEVCLFPLTDLQARQRQARWKILSGGALMLLLGFAASHYFSARLSVPVEKLAVDSEMNRAQRERAETALQQTSVELQRSVRFSADASHQLKTPVTVLRAGLDELLAHEQLSAELREEISELIHQTYRLTGVIEDLLLLSRLDAGRLQLALAPVDLSQLLEAELDDLSALPDSSHLAIEPDIPAGLHIAGEERYTTLIVRNLLENARKYNRGGGRIRVSAQADGEHVRVSVGNTGHPIPSAAQEHIFERFHRGPVGENIPGHGLGLNLARELAQLHGGDLRLVRSQGDWTEFEVCFRSMEPASRPVPEPA